MKNKYLPFVSDKTFEECIKKAMKTYKDSETSLSNLNKKEPLSILKSAKNTTDGFKTLLDIYGHEFDLNEWKLFEISRALDLGNRSMSIIFHVGILSNVNGWKIHNVANSPDKERMIKNKDNSIFIDIRNLQHSLDSDKKYGIRDRFDEILKSNPDAMCYHGFIISNNYEKNLDQIYHLRDRKDHENIRKISGDLIYQKVTGDEKALSKTYNALRLYLKENSDHNLSAKDEETLNQYQRKIFN
ncbi:Eco47II family restriction endonuclease [Methanobacterium sp.]|uniref:Eco47II family restriction endonuclease n=1 Tax=Methanobacterium sp. TaxID=2164 RepID=UPI002ABC494B|nr:Eco47II family restriction endonuclease [Methanobacterium sp.]MDY9922739.1 Eco47II family restriction endonuclease [Methanobacterium sp.]